jgi:hypothetical protein
MHDLPSVRKYGPEADTLILSNIGTCAARAYTTANGTAVDQNKPVTVFNLRFDQLYYDSDKEKDTAQNTGNHQVFLAHVNEEDKANQVNTCTYYLPFPSFDVAAKLEATQFIPAQKDSKTEWPGRCDAAKEYLGVIADRVLALAPRKTPPTPPTLSTKAPCLKKDEILGQLPGWTEDPNDSKDLYQEPYLCVIKPNNDNANYYLEIYISFRKGPDPTEADGGKVTVAGLSGVKGSNKVAGWSETLIYRPADSDDTNSGLQIHINMAVYPKKRTDSVSPDLSSLIDKIGEIVANGAK